MKKKTFSRGLIWNRKNFNTEIHVFAPMKFSGSVKIQIQVNTEIIKWLCDVLTFLTDCYKRWLSAHLRSRDPCRIKSYWLPAKKLQYTQGHIVVDHLQRRTACHVWLGVYRCLLIAHLLCEYLIVAKLGVVNLYLKVIKLWLTCTCSCIYLITHYNFNSIILDK